MKYTYLDAVNMELFRDTAILENQRLEDKAKRKTNRINIFLNIVIFSLLLTIVLLEQM